jgi:hypothetical protein
MDLPPQHIRCIGVVVAGQLIFSSVLRKCRYTIRIPVLTILSIAIFHSALTCGYVAIPAPLHLRQQTKVFGIGLSRTGTTSLTVALNDAGISTYHALPHLLDWPDSRESGNPMPNRWWADAYDGHTDIQSSVVFKQLAEMYPTAKFVYNRRPANKWGPSMFKFMAKHDSLWTALQMAHDWGMPVPPVDWLFEAMYGEGYRQYSAAEWTERYHKHDADVLAYFAQAGKQSQLLNISFTEGEGWETLGPFLGVDTPPGQTGAFPRADVFEVSQFAQPIWQVLNLLACAGI